MNVFVSDLRDFKITYVFTNMKQFILTFPLSSLKCKSKTCKLRRTSHISADWDDKRLLQIALGNVVLYPPQIVLKTVKERKGASSLNYVSHNTSRGLPSVISNGET